jgi:hypothetical protein
MFGIEQGAIEQLRGGQPVDPETSAGKQRCKAARVHARFDLRHIVVPYRDRPMLPSAHRTRGRGGFPARTTKEDIINEAPTFARALLGPKQEPNHDAIRVFREWEIRPRPHRAADLLPALRGRARADVCDALHCKGPTGRVMNVESKAESAFRNPQTSQVGSEGLLLADIEISPSVDRSAVHPCGSPPRTEDQNAVPVVGTFVIHENLPAPVRPCRTPRLMSTLEPRVGNQVADVLSL